MRHSVDIDINIARKRNLMLVIDEHRFPGQMTSFSLIYFKMQLAKVKESNLLQGFLLFPVRIPER